MDEKSKSQENQGTTDAKSIIDKLAKGETNETQARWQVKQKLLSIAKDRDRITASTVVANVIKLPDNIARLEKERSENLEDKIEFLELNQDLENSRAPLQNTNLDEPDIRPYPAPITWLWGKSDFAFLYDILSTQGAIDCGPKVFAALFSDNNNKPMPADFGKYNAKSTNPRNEVVRKAYSLIQKHKPNPEN